MQTNFTAPTHDEMATISKRVLELDIPENLKLFVQPLQAVLQTAYTPFAAAVAQETYSGLGKKVQDADRKRDQYFIGVRDALKSFERMDFEGADDIYQIIKRHGTDLHSEKFDVESNKLLKLLEELAVESNAAKINTLGLTAQVSKLQAAHDDFETLALEQKALNSNLREGISATQLRPAVAKALRNYCTMVTSLSETNAEWNAFYNHIKELTRIHKSSSKPKETENLDPTAPTQGV